MTNRAFKIFLITLIFICIVPYTVLGAKVEGYTTISGTFNNIENGISTDSVVQALIIKNELLEEGKISALFSSNVKIAQYPVGIAFAGKGIRDYGNVSGSNIFYLRAYFIGGNIVLDKSEHGIATSIKSVSLNDSVFESDTVKLAVSFSSDGEVRIFVNDSEVINITLNPRLLYGGEFGFCAGGDGNTFEITNILITSLSHTEHTPGEIVPETSASCINEGKKEHSLCTVCGELIYQKEGIWTVATEDELTVPKDSDNHIDSKESVEWICDEKKHSKICRCGEVFVSGNHDIASDALEGTCTVCGYNKIHTCNDLTRIYATLGNCVAKGKKEHYKCNDCGKFYIRSGNSYVEKTKVELESEIVPENHIDSVETLEWTYDDSKHYKICQCGEVLSSGKHDISSTALEGSCSTCAYERIHACTYTEIPEILADCMTNGRKAHYKCEACKKLYIKSGDMYIEIAKSDLATAKDPSNHIDSASALEWICDEGGHKKACRCKAILVFERHDISESALEGVCSVCGYTKTHTCIYTKIPEIEANCISEGVKLHYKCSDCGKLYVKNGGIYTETSENELEIPINPDEHVDSVKNLTWTYDDYSHTKTCRCGTVLAANKHSISDSALSGTCATCGYVRTHICTYTAVPEIPANCMTKGKIAHYKCEACGKLYIKDENGYTRIYTADLDTPKDRSNHVDLVSVLEWICDESGHKKVCRCGEILALEEHDIDPDALEGVCSECGYAEIHTCTYTKISEIPANCISKGRKLHYKCNDCGKLYVKSGGVYTEITENELQIPINPDEHIDSVRNLTWTYDDYSHTKTCRCGTVLTSNKHSISDGALSGTCATCGYVRTHTCTYTAVPEIPANCMTKGKIAHYKCEACGKLYVKNGEGYTRIYTADLDTPKDSSNHVDLVSALEWICDESGHKKICRCGEILAFDKHDIDESALEGVCSVCGYTKTHTCAYTKIPEISANCISKGRKLHYKCNDCGKLYIKNGGVYTEVTENELQIPINPEEHVDSVKNLTWTYDDYSHTKTCRCGTVLATNNHTISETALSGTCATCGYVRTHTCTYTAVPEIPADCMTKGKIAHYKCEACGKLYIKNGETYARIYTADLDTPKDTSNHVDLVSVLEWICGEGGHKKVCRCGEILALEEHDIDPDALEGICLVCGYVKSHTCTYTKIPKVEANCISKGVKLHYKCSDCGKLYIKNGGVYTETTENELEIPINPDEHADSVKTLAWTYDDKAHTKTCRCGTVLAANKHTISETALSGTCATCGYVRIHVCTYTQVPEIPANCMAKGKIAHYKCEACGKLYVKNGESYTRIYTADLDTPKDTSNHVDLVSALEWTHDESGHKKICQCGEVLAFEEHDIDPDALEGVCLVCGYVKTHTCTYEKISEVLADCITKGQKLHYMCSDCGKLYIKNGGIYTETTEKELEIPEDTSNHIDSVRNLTWTYDDKAHTKTCRCGTVLASNKHSISDGALSGTCATCGYVRTHTCTYTAVPEIPANCMTKGKIAHYKCETCGKLYIKNGETYARIYTADLDTPKDTSNHVDLVSALEWTHDESGHKKVCRCKAVLVFERHDIPESALEGVCSVCGYTKTHTCTYTKIPEIPADCITKGQKLHYKCNDCGKLYVKNGGVYTETSENELEIPENPEEHIDSVRNLTWTYDDHSHTKTCRCGAVLATNKHTISETALSGTCATCGYVRTHICTYTAVPEIPADCMTKGKIAHYKCESCKKLYVKNGEGYTRIYTADLDTPKDRANHVDSVNNLPWDFDENTHKKTCRCGKILLSEAHDISPDVVSGTCSICSYEKSHICEYTYVPPKSADCTTDGNKEHYKCLGCGKICLAYGDKYVEISIEDIVVKASHKLEKIDAVIGNCITESCEEYYKCALCGKLFSDEKGENEIENIPKGEKDLLNHTDSNNDGKCDLCLQGDSNKQSGENGEKTQNRLVYYLLIAAVIILFILCLLLLIIIKRLLKNKVK